VTIWLSLALALLLLPLIPLAWFLFRQLGKQWHFFVRLAETLGGSVTRVPMGVRFEVDGVPVRLFALQGVIHYRAALALRSDPGILVTRKFKRFDFLQAFHYSPSRERFSFQAPIDDLYGFRARELPLMRTIFTEAILSRLASNRRLARIEIRRKGIRAGFFILSHAEDEEAEAVDAVEILNLLLLRLRTSGLAE
jgi:hypothetical protein